MEYTSRCLVCRWVESWTTPEASQAAAVWHVWDEHPDVWVMVIGDRPPDTFKPENFGRRFEDWESQR